jgi:hypothetical protein
MVGLIEDLAARDSGRIRARMARPFTFVAEGTDVGPLRMTPQEAAAALVDGLDDPFAGYHPLGPGSRVRCVRSVPGDVAALGSWMLEGAYDAAILTRGWGRDGDEEAFVYLVRGDDGSVEWGAILYSLAGFEP